MLTLAPTFKEHLVTAGWSDDDIIAAALKFQVLSEGLKISPDAYEVLADHWSDGIATDPIRTRSGVSGGLDLLVANRIYINAPVAEAYSLLSSVTLSADGGKLTLRSGEYECAVDTVRKPQFYDATTSTGREARVVAQMCSGDRLCYSLTGPTCSFWHESDRCGYCSIGQNADADTPKRVVDELLEVVEMAVRDPVRPARHLLLGGGTPAGSDMGALRSIRIVEAIRAANDPQVSQIPIYVMIAAPLDDAWIEKLWVTGVDELGINLEFWSEQSWRKYIPGKDKRIGKERYLAALTRSAELFGPVRSRSILVAGLEPLDQTLIAVRELCARGVMPIISPFRPLTGTLLEARRGAQGVEYQALYVAASQISREYGLPVGPVCAPCMNNVLALPEFP